MAGVQSIEGIDSIGRKNKINAIPLNTVMMIALWQLNEGNDRAKALLISGFMDSFSSIVLEQCGIKLTLEERQNVITFYLDWYHTFQDWVRDTHIKVYGTKPSSDYYREMAVLINTHLFGKPHFKCDRLTHAGNKELRKLENFQMAFLETNMAQNAGDPVYAMRQYISVIKSI